MSICGELTLGEMATFWDRFFLHFQYSRKIIHIISFPNSLTCSILQWHGGLNDGAFILHSAWPVIATLHTICVRTNPFLRNSRSKQCRFPGNSKNHFFQLSKCNHTGYTSYEHVSYGTILYNKPTCPYFHLLKYEPDLASHSWDQICTKILLDWWTRCRCAHTLGD